MAKFKKLSTACKLYRDSLLEILLINLKTEDIEELKVSNTFAICETEMNLASYVKFMIDENNIYDEDIELYKEKININYLRKYFKTRSSLTFRYRQFINGEYRFVSLRLLKSKKYSFLNQVIYGYFLDINDIQNKEFRFVEELKHKSRIEIEENKSKTAFLSRFSHDIKNPINVINGMVTLCLSSLDENEVACRYLKKIVENTDYMLNLIDEILDSSKKEFKKNSINYRYFNLDNFFYDIISNNKMIYPDYNISLFMKVEHKNIYADMIKLKEIITNLLSNSCKYSKKTGNEIKIEVEEEFLNINSANYKFIIEDKGIGMNKDFINRIFIPFERAKTSTVEGTGLGMSIVRNLIELMGGEIKIESEVGKGTRISFNLSFKFENDYVVTNEFVSEYDLVK